MYCPTGSVGPIAAGGGRYTVVYIPTPTPTALPSIEPLVYAGTPTPSTSPAPTARHSNTSHPTSSPVYTLPQVIEEGSTGIVTTDNQHIRSGTALCPLGHYCTMGQANRCPSGRYGDITGLQTSACRGTYSPTYPALP